MNEFSEMNPVEGKNEDYVSIQSMMEKSDVILERTYDTLVAIQNGLNFTGAADKQVSKDVNDMRSAARAILEKAGACAVIVEEILTVLYGKR